MERLEFTPAESAALFNGPNDCMHIGPCRMSGGMTKMVGAVLDMGTATPANPHGTGPKMDRSQEKRIQEYIFEDVLNPSNTMLYPGFDAGKFDACGRDVILVTYYKETKTMIGMAIPQLKKVVPHLGKFIPQLGKAVPQLGKAVPQMQSAMPKLDGLLDSIGQDRDLNRRSWVVAVIGINNGHVISDTEFPFWRGSKISTERKTTLARVMTSIYDRRQDYLHYFKGGQTEQESGYA